jgi:hypothetical protein
LWAKRLQQGVAGLGSGGIGQNTARRRARAHKTAGRSPAPLQWVFGGGCGIDDPDDADLAANGRLKNFVCEGHLEWRPQGPLVFGFEFRRLKTSYTAGDFTANHINLAAGYRFEIRSSLAVPARPRHLQPPGGRRFPPAIRDDRTAAQIRKAGTEDDHGAHHRVLRITVWGQPLMQSETRQPDVIHQHDGDHHGKSDSREAATLVSEVHEVAARVLLR